MPKMKTHKGAAKRFKRTASGKLKRSSNFVNKYHGKKTSRRLRNLRKAKLVSASDQKRIEQLLPYK
ncbi:50S ribosomal protein L35 [Clostridium sp. D2Q-11]|uniref:Large ribosomal subunit protein bL35 n=1 Tax=Anaeromonas frigoriresistens TaxID=2683708 RepID=A0A942URS1_9FIRM|nr:50S ribosomal protein L35 [Anaeromonas frigoriresistens]MBS4537993.1 50S ribosomal protein L35 [Anaeromonas frigoriresistens]